MVSDISMRVGKKVAATDDLLDKEIRNHKEVRGQKVNAWRIVRRSYDARQREIKVNLTVRVATGSDTEVKPDYTPVCFDNVAEAPQSIVIVGAGPAGLFAALKAIELGIKPIVIERGKDVDSRRKDITTINRERRVIEDSNYCFGEGGAGTFSDGKLFTRSKKRGDSKAILNLLHQHGASEDILIDAHAHIGSELLPDIIRNIRTTIIEKGGEVRFSTKAESLKLKDGRAVGIVTSEGEEISGAVVLAIGHSARDTIRTLHSQNIEMEAKGFAMGVRLEHPQQLIDRLQYHSEEGRGKYLPAAEYSFVAQSDGRGVYSFCMCPGGVVVPAASAPGESVVNGMSASARAGRWANSGMVVQILPGDFKDYEKYGVLQLLHLQEDLEKKFFVAAGNSLTAPAQRMTDFVNGVKSETLPPTSYIPGLKSDRLDLLLPPFIAHRLQDGFRQFDRKCHGFLTAEAKLIGLESRTSSPVRLPRDPSTLEHTTTPGLYPAGEGAGYAGGIVSAAVDGQRCVQAYYDKYIKPQQEN